MFTYIDSSGSRPIDFVDFRFAQHAV